MLVNMRYVVLVIVAFLFSCSKERIKDVKVGVDPTWAPLVFNDLQPYVNGYTDELLQEIATYSGISFEKISGNWDTLLVGLEEGKYELLLCSIPPYNFNQERYDFTQNFLDLGPVLITSIEAKNMDLSTMNEGLIGVITGDPSTLILEKYARVIVRNYSRVVDLLDAVASGEVNAAVLDRLPATKYVRDLYGEKLKIASKPMNEMGLHAITLKGKSPRLIGMIQEHLDRMKRKKSLEALQQKWGLQ